MIESIMVFGIGFLFAALSVIVVVPLVHNRAVRLTTGRLEGAIPASIAEISAEKDLLRAEFAISTRRLEMTVEQLQTKNASQLAELGKKGDAINQLKSELRALRNQLGVVEEELAVKAIAVREAERAVSDHDSELAKLRERVALADAQKAEITALQTQLEAKGVAVTEAERALSDKDTELAKLAGELAERSALANVQKTEISALQTQIEAKAAAANEVECALAGKDTELAKLAGELAERSALADAQKTEISALQMQIEAKAAAAHEVECALVGKDSELTELASQLAERSALADARKAEIIALQTQIDGKVAAVHEAEHALADKDLELTEFASQLAERSALADARKAEIITLQTQIEARAAAVREAEGALAGKGLELAKLVVVLDERSALADAQKAEIIALESEVQGLNDRLDGASNGLKAAEDRRDAERIELEAVTQKLMEERSKFDNFHRRVGELVQQVMARSTQDKMFGRRAQELENLFVEQSQQVNERELELQHLRREIEVASRAEADLRVAIIETEDRANSAIHTLEAEKAKLQAALDRANGECVRLAYELKRGSLAA